MSECQHEIREGFWRVVNVTPSEEIVLDLLYRRPSVSHDGLYSVLYDSKPDSDVPSLGVTKVFICNLRKKLAPLGVVIQCSWGRGYFMAPEDKARLRQLVETAA